MSESARLRCNIRQKNNLVDYMVANKDFTLGILTGPMGMVQQNGKWAKLAEVLANYGPNKTVDQWLTIWRDLKKTREKSANTRTFALALDK